MSNSSKYISGFRTFVCQSRNILRANSKLFSSVFFPPFSPFFPCFHISSPISFSFSFLSFSFHLCSLSLFQIYFHIIHYHTSFSPSPLSPFVLTLSEFPLFFFVKLSSIMMSLTWHLFSCAFPFLSFVLPVYFCYLKTFTFIQFYHTCLFLLLFSIFKLFFIYSSIFYSLLSLLFYDIFLFIFILDFRFD